MKPTAISVAIRAVLGIQSAPSFDVSDALCSRNRCGRMATWHVGVRAWAHKTEHLDNNYIGLRFPLTVCDQCKKSIVISDVINNHSWRKVVQSLRVRGFADPDRMSLQFEFEPILMETA